MAFLRGLAAWNSSPDTAHTSYTVVVFAITLDLQYRRPATAGSARLQRRHAATTDRLTALFHQQSPYEPVTGGFTTRQKLQEAGIPGYSGQQFRKRPRQSGISRYRTAEHAHDVLPRLVINLANLSLNHIVTSSMCYENRGANSSPAKPGEAYPLVRDRYPSQPGARLLIPLVIYFIYASQTLID